MRKKVWSKPRLVVLVRGKPEEGVLNGCKTLYEDGPDTISPSCWNGGTQDSCYVFCTT